MQKFGKMNRWWYVCFFFVLGGVLFLVEKKRFLIEESALFYPQLLNLAQMEWKNTNYLLYILLYRMPLYGAILLVGERIRRMRVIIMVEILGAFLYGFVLAECMIRYGIGGILLGVGLGFPHVILYILAMEMLLRIKIDKKTNKKRNKVYSIIVYGISLFIQCLGIFSECFWNVTIVKQTIFLL